MTGGSRRAAARTRPADGADGAGGGIRADRIDVFYGRHRALEEVSVDVPFGSALAILGRNGAGKTTLLRSVVNGFGVHVKGDVLIDGARIAGLTPDQVVKRHSIGFVPDDRRIFPLTVLENLRVASLGSRGWKADVKRVLGLFPFLQDHTSQLATTLSGGEQQALAIARAAMRQPRYLLLDEPGEGLAPVAVQRLTDGIKRLLAEGDCTVVMVERNMEMISALCDAAIGMSAGRIIWSGAVSDLRDDPLLLEQVLLPAATEPGTGGHHGSI
jgi:branched-chain amino acid transport system ATP-binding protein